MEEYKLYTFVDITHTGQYRAEPGKETARWKEQNFNTIVQTLNIRSNIIYYQSPASVEVRGSLVGFNTDKVIRLWRFDFATERYLVYEDNNDPIAFLKEDFELVPYIQGLDEWLHQTHAVFITEGPLKNIVFHKKQ
jgi:predicted ribosome-associated RNA-binding protein Tma20